MTWDIRRLAAGIATAILLALLPLSLAAQDLEPRSYSNLPVGQNFAAAGYAYSDGEISPSPGVPIENGKLTMKAGVVAYARSIDLWGDAGKFDMNYGRICFKGSAIFRGEYVEGDRCGTSDPQFRLTWLFYGAKAMDMAEFRKTPTGRVIGMSLKIIAPLGDYNNENLINSGANRWAIRPEIGISNRWGSWNVDASFGGTFYTDNDNYSRAGSRFEQDPLYQVKANLIYNLPGGRWFSVDANYFWGGETERDGVSSDNRQSNSRVGITFSQPLTAQHSLKFYAHKGVISKVGNDSDTFGVAWQYRWAD
jgi:hypothetical protein